MHLRHQWTKWTEESKHEIQRFMKSTEGKDEWGKVGITITQKRTCETCGLTQRKVEKLMTV